MLEINKGENLKNYKYIVLSILIVLPAMLLAGCAKKTTTTSFTTASQEEDYFPGVDRTTTVMPNSVDSSSSSNSAAVPSSSTVLTNLKIGGITQIRSYQYNLEGLVKITSASSLELQNFSYNGSCSGIKLYVTSLNNPNMVIAQFPVTNQTYNNSTIKLDLGDKTINDFDAVAMTCSNKTEPVLVVSLRE